MVTIQSFILELIVIFIFIILNALFVAMEFALVRIRMTEIETLITKGINKAKIVKHLKENIDKYISASQLGITVINLLLGWIGESIFTGLFSKILLKFNINYPLLNTFAVVFGILFITFATVTIGEIAPKTIAIRYPTKIALYLSLPLKIFYNIFKPFIWLLNISANLILRIFGIATVPNTELVHSEEEIKLLIEEGRKSGIIDSTEHQLIEKIFDFNDKTANDIMIPRNNIMALDIDESRDKIVQTVIEEGYSRIPVYRETIDNIIGIIYSKDLISASEHRDIIVLQDILRPAYFIPETKHIGELLKDFQKKRLHMGLVVNEHGGVEGLITLEDIIEEIVGEIEDEYDVDVRNIEKDKLGIYLVNPIISIEEFNKKFNVDIPVDNDEYQTLSGFLQKVTGHIPEIYERVDYKGTIFTIMKKMGNKLLQVKIQKM
ncbi:MAG TPA: hemolysin family protein [Ignavibacteria bacterium]